MDTMPAAPRRVAWTNVWIRVAAAGGIWLASAVFFFVITPQDLRVPDQAVVMVAWGAVGAAFAALWQVVQKPIADLLIARIAPRRGRVAAAFAIYTSFVIAMIAIFATLDVGQGGSDWWAMGMLAFLCAGSIPAVPWLKVLVKPVPSD